LVQGDGWIMPKRRKSYPIARLSCPHCGETIVVKKNLGLYKERRRKKDE